MSKLSAFIIIYDYSYSYFVSLLCCTGLFKKYIISAILFSSVCSSIVISATRPLFA